MASQQVVFAETIRAMKIALKRKEVESDSDESIRQHTNRGNKLKRKAHRVREGRLDTSGGQSYRKRVNHAGYSRYIIHENPPMYDHDGDLVDHDEEYDDENMSPAEDNPFQDTKVEDLLMPLTAPGNLADHPGLSLPYTSEHITEMAEKAREMLHRERETLTQVKALLESFRGDERWAPLGSLETAQDAAFLDGDGAESFLEDRSVKTMASGMGAAPAATGVNTPLSAAPAKTNGTSNNVLGIHMQANPVNGVDTTDMALEKPTQANGAASTQSGKEDIAEDKTNQGAPEASNPDDQMDISNDPKEPVITTDQTNGSEDGEMDDDAQPSHAMTTRAKARTPPPEDATRSFTSEAPSSIPPVSAFFLPPLSSLPDQTLGLPPGEADETQRALIMYVQKQEEVVRGIEQLLFGLLKADRMRKEVWKWAKADAHVGEMSDGEDWYDKEEWGLTEDLVKGKEEEEVEDEGKRRGRRREGKGRNTGA
ncbi:Transcriptional regulatory protein rxt2 [Sphaceloma murrayae]|uniref:Transcriptional regulatory protein rxt2 n=1 Tax=Sphaceloma murrayae TaxID=2082308 RepID=A0A2K1QXS0_9PEZI|nr:Transcriptional regulatory protein rxt2 [Sphaceloma murrayae]